MNSPITSLNQTPDGKSKSSGKNTQAGLKPQPPSAQAKAIANKAELYLKNIKSNNDKKAASSSNAELYEKAERAMCSIHEVIEDPAKLIKHELRPWKQRKKHLKGIFLLDKHKLKKLARNAGMKEVSSFIYNYKQTSGTFAFPRPNFETAWKFRVLSSGSFATVGHLLRILHCCLRWDVINIRPPKGVNHSTTTSKGNLLFMIIGWRKNS